jgi:hypothetical protein
MSFRRFLLTFATAISAVWAQGTTTPATTRNYLFPPVGLGSSETASITVVNTAMASSSGTVVAPTPVPFCTGTISFSNANGAIGTPASFTVGSGQFKTVTLPFSSAALTGNRVEIQGKVSLAVSTSPCSLIFSMETYDSTAGATHAVLSATLANVGPVGPIVPLVPIVP